MTLVKREREVICTRFRKLGATLLACIAVFNFTAIPAGAAAYPDSGTVVSRAAGRLNCTVPAQIVMLVGSAFSLESGDKISFDCTYTPKSASVDFGYIDLNNVFHYLSCTSGSIYKALEVTETGQYTLAIRNNESYAVAVTGTVKY